MTEPDTRAGDTDNLQIENDFWRFSLGVYGQGEVAQECLELQRLLAIDVNLLLFCAWLGARTMAVSRTDIEAASEAVAFWHANVVRPLRGVRQQVKKIDSDDVQNFWAKVKTIELDAEQIEQAILFAYSKRIENVRTSANCRDVVGHNIKQYLAMRSSAALRPADLSATRLIEAACRLNPKS